MSSASRPIDTLFLWQQDRLSRNKLLDQPNRLACEGSRLFGNRSSARIWAFFSRCIRSLINDYRTINAGSNLVCNNIDTPRLNVNTSQAPKLKSTRCSAWQVSSDCTRRKPRQIRPHFKFSLRAEHVNIMLMESATRNSFLRNSNYGICPVNFFQHT